MAPTSTTISLAAGLRDAGFTGRVTEPGDAGYDDARKVFNGVIDRHPAAVAHATDAEDVAAAIRAARAAGLAFTVRAGGHSISGPLDPRRRAVHRPARARTRCASTRRPRSCASAAARCSARSTRATAGVRARDPGRAHLPHRRRRAHARRRRRLADARHGLTIDSLVAAEVVLADGRMRAGERDGARRPVLGAARRRWRLRRRHGVHVPRPPGRPDGLGGMLIYPWAQAREALRARPGADGRRAGGADDVRHVCSPRRRGPPFPAALQGRPAVAVGFAWAGAVADGERRSRRCARPSRRRSTSSGPMPYSALQTMLDQTAQHGWGLLGPHALPARGRATT